MTVAPRTFEEAEAVLASNLPRYESRPHQQELARAIERDFFAKVEPFPADGAADQRPKPEAMFAHAPTGLGKSLAYLIPAILSGKRVVVSVTTKALQDQLSTQDLPFLQANLLPFSWAVLKGRSSYLCLNREVSDGEVPALPQIAAWVKANPSFSGLREDLPFDLQDREWAAICSNTDECSSMGCKTEEMIDGCYASRARLAARQARVVVVNHSLFFTDLMIRLATNGNANLLGDFDAVIFDEAHEVHEVASSTLSTEVSMGSIRSLGFAVRAYANRFAAREEGILQAVQALDSAGQGFFYALPSVSQGKSRTLRLTVDHLEAVADQALALIEALDALKDSMASGGVAPGVDGKALSARRSNIASRIRNLRQALGSMLSDPMTETVRWVEAVPGKRGEVNTVVKIAPIDISDYLSENLFDVWPVLMCSATLAVKGNFDFQAKQLGVERYVGKIVGTPFDYATNTRLYVPRTLPAPNLVPAWEAAVLDEIRTLVNAAEGRTLVLFTSVAHMRRAYNALAGVLDYPVKMQGQESVPALKEWFLASNETVLFGTKSFMTGFDARGEACSQVIITKMPFPVPDEPLTEARTEKIEAEGGNSFMDYSVPVMSLVLQQAAGRLMRHSTDRGVVAILDNRMVTKFYGKRIVADLPPMTLVKDRSEAHAFLAQTVAHYSQGGN